MNRSQTKPRSNTNTTCNPCVPAPSNVMSMDEFSGLVNQAVQQLLPAYFFDQVQGLSTAQVAELTGATKETVAEWIRAGKLSASKPGKDYIITVANLKQFLKDTKVKAPVISMHSSFKKQNAI